MIFKNLWFVMVLAACIAAGLALWHSNNGHALAHTDEQNVSDDKKIQHLGIIMDGNRRWAKKQGYKPWIGHKKGVEPVRTTIEFCIKNNIPYLTLYVFSLENFNRPPEELSYLFDVLAQQIADQEREKLFRDGIKVNFVGDRNLFPEKLKPLIHEIEEKTKNGDKLTVNLLFCYGGQQEIIAACTDIAQLCIEGKISPHDITPQLLSQHLWSGNTPPPDLIIRTAGDQRLSNFLTWSAAYSELTFLPCFWPEITDAELTAALNNFSIRKRTFGK